MLVYVVVFCVAVGVALAAEYGHSAKGDVELPRGHNFIAFLVATVLAGVAASRWHVGTDYWTYEMLFPVFAAEATQSLSPLDDPGIRIIAWVSMALTGDSATMFAISAIITVGLTVRTLWRWSPAFAFSIGIYILSGAWHGSFNGVRQYLACAILFAGHRYIVDRRLGKWLVIVLIATLFHVSALAAVLLYFVPTKRTSLAIQITVVLLGFVGMLSFESLLGGLADQTGEYEQWTGSYANESLHPLRVAFAFLPIALYWLLRNREAIVSSGTWFYVNMLLIYGATYLASANSAYMARFTIYALPFVAIGLVPVTSVSNAKERTLIRAALLCLYAAFFYVEVSATNNLVNFQWIWQRP